MIDSSVTDFLGRYFDLARKFFMDGRYALASFFALTIIEECGKILYLRDFNVPSKEARRLAKDHSTKYITAVINLLIESERFNSLPQMFQEEVNLWFDTDRLMALRNNALYLHFDRYGQWTVPERLFSHSQAAMHVYLAGFTAVELGEYVDIDEEWISSISQSAESFRKEYIGS